MQQALNDTKIFSSARGDVLEFIKANMPIPPGISIMTDPPENTGFRSALTKVLTPHKMSALEPQIRAFCARALDPLVEDGEFDFIEHLSQASMISQARSGGMAPGRRCPSVSGCGMACPC